MSLMFYTYVHVRPDTGVIFNVGKGSKNRAYSSAARNRHWHHVVNKNNGVFEVRIVNWFNNEQDALDAEVWQISQLIHLGNLVNKTNGGEGFSGGRHTEQSKKLMSEKQKIIQNRPEMVEFNRKRMMGNPSRTGMKDSESTRIKKKEAVKVARNKPESIEKTRAISLEMHKNPEFKEKHRSGCKKFANSPQNIIRLKNQTGSSHPRSRAVVELTEMRVFVSLSEASRHYGVNNINAVITGKQKHTKGRIFAHLDTLPEETRKLLADKADR